MHSAYCIAAGVDRGVRRGNGVHPRRVRPRHEQLLVLGPGANGPQIRRLLHRREHPASRQQSGHGLVGWLLGNAAKCANGIVAGLMINGGASYGKD